MSPFFDKRNNNNNFENQLKPISLKRYLIFSFAVILTVSCAKFQSEPFVDSRSEISNKSSIEQTARDIYEHFYGPATKSFNSTVSSVITLGDSLATVVNFAAGGFVIIQNGGDELPLAVSQSGAFLSEEGEETPQIVVSSILRGLKPDPIFPPDTSYAFIQEVVTYQDSLIVNPMIEVKWHQHEPFNMFAPNGLAGCAAVGVAQAISVFSFPSSISLTYPGADFSETTLDWLEMKDEAHSFYLPFDPHDYLTCTYCLQCARLMRQLGVYCNIQYNNGLSGTSLDDYRVPLSNLGYSSLYADYSVDNVLSSLQSGYPIIIRGENAIRFGHVFNVDGCKHYEKNYTLMVYESGSWRVDSYRSESETYLHLCYGQQLGLFDGYYLARITNYNQPVGGSPYYYENNTLQGHEWNNDLKITYNIHPLD